jgi:DNA-binding NarL/FixJ family response regulator
MNILMLAF